MALDWHGCYNSSWQGVIVPEAFVHPAKGNRGLAKRIYQHAIEQGWLEPGSVVIDPFAGIGGFAFHAMYYGLNWIGVELEQKFVDLCQENIDLWNARYEGKLPNWGTGVILQGDSRKLGEIIDEANGVISSPPYAELQVTPGDVGRRMTKERWGTGTNLAAAHPVGYGDHPAQLGNMPEGEAPSACISSPPYSALQTRTGKVDEASWSDGKPRPIGMSQRESEGYGDTDGQLGNMPEGDVDGVISSPPYAESTVKSDGGYDDEKLEQAIREGKSLERARWGTNKGSAGQVGYGDTQGQLSTMPPGDVNGVISSPPYSTEVVRNRGKAAQELAERVGVGASDRAMQDEYGDTDGQLSNMPAGDVNLVSSPPWAGNSGGMGEKSENAIDKALFKRHLGSMVGAMDSQDNLGNSTGNTFWSAARTILQQTYAVLSPGAHAIWVTKRFVRNKAIVEFSQQWCDLCESVGFELIHWHRAWLEEDRGTQYDLFGNAIERKVQRLSFFRRLHMKKYPHLAILWEDVLCMQKPSHV